MRKRDIFLMIMLIGGFLLCACNKSEERLEATLDGEAKNNIIEENTVSTEEIAENTEKDTESSGENVKNTEENAKTTDDNTESTEAKADIDEQIEKGYDLPVSDDESEEAETDCKRTMELMIDIYNGIDKKDASNDIISDEIINKMTKRIKDTGSCVITNKTYSNMENYKKFERFLNSCISGNSGAAVIYEIHEDGSIGRKKYIYNGNDMYVVAANVTWNDVYESVVTYISYTRIKEWRYTDKGWFCYELCVPEYPEVTEIIDGSCLVRVKPITDDNREMSEKCVLGLGYQGNNLLCSNWDADCMEGLDYNGLYEYLYAMKYQQSFNIDDYPNGIPKREFESLISEYLPIKPDMIRKYAVYDHANQTYVWERLGCFTYAPNFFGTSTPEVIDIKDNEDGTVTLTVDAVCEMILCNDAVITHKLTVRFREDGSFQYLRNEILDDGVMNIPDYQYRVSNE